MQEIFSIIYGCKPCMSNRICGASERSTHYVDNHYFSVNT